jgi:hypothetical protein
MAGRYISIAKGVIATVAANRIINPADVDLRVIAECIAGESSLGSYFSLNEVLDCANYMFFNNEVFDAFNTAELIITGFSQPQKCAQQVCAVVRANIGQIPVSNFAGQ